MKERLFSFVAGEGLTWSSSSAMVQDNRNEDLRTIGLTNLQLAIVYLIDVQDIATVSDLMFGLILSRHEVLDELLRLRDCGLVRSIPENAKLMSAFTLTDHGKMLLLQGLEIWRRSCADARTEPRIPDPGQDAHGAPQPFSSTQKG